jgi:hypothetical protein
VARNGRRSVASLLGAKVLRGIFIRRTGQWWA